MITNFNERKNTENCGFGTSISWRWCVPSLPFPCRWKTLPCVSLSPSMSETHFWLHRLAGCSSALPGCEQMPSKMGGYGSRLWRCLGQHCTNSVSVGRGLLVAWHVWLGQATLKINTLFPGRLSNVASSFLLAFLPAALGVPEPFLGAQL